MWLRWVGSFFAKNHILKYAEFRVYDTSRLYQHWRVFVHRVSQMPSRRMREYAKTRKRSRMPSSTDFLMVGSQNCTV